MSLFRVVLIALTGAGHSIPQESQTLAHFPEFSSVVTIRLVGLLLLFPTLALSAEPPSADALIKRHRQEKSPVWADGDAVTFFYQADVDKVDVFFGGDTRPLTRIADTDVWTVSVKLPDLERGMFSYFFVYNSKQQPAESGSTEAAEWRGPKAPRAPAVAADLKGTVLHCELHSQALAASRKVAVYLPPGHDPQKPVRVLFATDGEAIEPFVRVLEPLILGGKVPATAVIAPHSGGRPGGDYDVKKDLRAQEYFPGIDDNRFADHESFFTKELPAWAEKRFGVSGKSADRAIFGYSNGGRFAVEMGIRHPGLFRTVLAFSVAGSGKFDLGDSEKEQPRFYLAAGTWDPNFHKCTSSLAEQLKKRQTSVEFSSRPAGHDMALWRDEFAAAMIWASK